MKFKTDFITYKGLYRSIETEKLNIPATDGNRTLLSNHMAIVIPLENGVIETKENGKLQHYAISEGVVYFKDNYAKILCDEIIEVGEIDKEKAKEELEKAQLNLNNKEKDYEVKRAKIKLTRALNLINASDKYGK